MYSLYYLVLLSSSDFCAAYYGYFDVLTQVLQSQCNTDEIGGSRLFLMTAAPRETMVAPPTRPQILSIHQPRPCPVWYSTSDLSGKYVLSLQANTPPTPTPPT